MAVREGEPAAHTAAVTRAADFLATQGNIDPGAFPAAVVLAMGQYRLGKEAEARSSLAQARKQLEKLDRIYPGTRERPSPAGNLFWMFDKALLAEAEALIEGTPAGAPGK